MLLKYPTTIIVENITMSSYNSIYTWKVFKFTKKGQKKIANLGLMERKMLPIEDQKALKEAQM